MSEYCAVVQISLMYRLKSVVESVLPCGMPSVIVCCSDCACSVWSVCVRLLKYEVRSAVVLLSKLKVCFSLWRSLVWEMVSYAFERSR